jgi:phosphatidylserine/phosphatidylglycerophosphate/cardiolipin synthase-like enzyme
MVRFTGDQILAAEARDIFNRDLARSQRIELEAWHKSRNWWRRFRERWAYFILVRLDPYVARWQQKRISG